MQQVHLPVFMRVLFVLLLIITIVFILIMGKNLLVPLFIAGMLSILLTPMCTWLESKRVPGTLSAFMALLSGIIIIGGIITLIVIQIKGVSKDLDNVSQRMNEWFLDIDTFFQDSLGMDVGLDHGLDASQLIDLIQSGNQTIPQVLLNTIGSLTGLILTPIFVFFMLIYRHHLGDFIAELFKNQDSKLVRREIFTIRRMVQGYIIGLLKVMAILAVLNTSALYFLGVEHALFFGLFAALLNIIPYLGPFLGAILPFFYAFLTSSSIVSPFFIIVLFAVIQLIESNFLTPKIVGSNVNLNAFITLLGLLVGGAIWGIVGMVLIIPTLAIMRRIFELSPDTMPFAKLLGEDKTGLKKYKKIHRKVDSDECIDG
ncbi:AI-2E family transporter [Echinicola pacifica]|uniref:AI-2E family transporter n=1 Tax=Echinicola pacifica TaxID=346377 RepID=A0A918UKW0_9BACT|nr:AI-2E family transporter [Echinicola pacifica]GGZ17238.1 AI-2E family transporter [Echinicola pacifica]